MSRLNHAGKFFVHPCGESYLKWSLGQSALLSDLVVTDLQIWVQKNQKRLALLTDISKCPENHHQLKYHILSTVTKILFLLTPQERSEMQRYWVEIRQNFWISKSWTLASISKWYRGEILATLNLHSVSPHFRVVLVAYLAHYEQSLTSVWNPWLNANDTGNNRIYWLFVYFIICKKSVLILNPLSAHAELCVVMRGSKK